VPGVSVGSSLNPSLYGQAVSFTATVTGVVRPAPCSSISTAVLSVAGDAGIGHGHFGHDLDAICGNTHGHGRLLGRHKQRGRHGDTGRRTSRPRYDDHYADSGIAGIWQRRRGRDQCAKMVTLKNTGSERWALPALPSAVTLLGQRALRLRKYAGCGEDLHHQVTFTPTSLGALSGSITLTDNASGSPQSVSLTGTGTVQATLTLHGDLRGANSEHEKRAKCLRWPTNRACR